MIFTKPPYLQLHHICLFKSLVTLAWVAFKDIGVWIGIKCVITSPRQARPLCRDSGHTSREGHKIKRADVLPQSWSYLAIRP